jgi:hypothetical protein
MCSRFMFCCSKEEKRGRRKREEEEKEVLKWLVSFLYGRSAMLFFSGGGPRFICAFVCFPKLKKEEEVSKMEIQLRSSVLQEKSNSNKQQEKDEILTHW